MKCISEHRCYIGEGPIWNDREKLLYQVNAGGNQVLKMDLERGEVVAENVPTDISSIGFTTDNRMIVATETSVGFLEQYKKIVPMYDSNFQIDFANDGKVGPDGKFYIGTQSRKRLKLSDDVDGKLYSIDASGNVKTLLDGLLLSNGMDWNMAENKFYHTDSATHIIREYEFDKAAGGILPTNRSVYLKGVDGFTIDQNDVIWAACWGKSVITAIDTNSMEIIDTISVPTAIPASCCFCGNDMEYLAVVTAKYNLDVNFDPQAGYTFLIPMKTPGRVPYRFF